jgi:predicted anti-sigma-YlaC factor YlaD
MNCDQAREALSARLDGEPVDEATLNNHVDTCAECSRWLSAAYSVTRRARLLPVPEVPDLTDQIVAAVKGDRLAHVVKRKRGTQIALVGIAVVQLILALGVLLGGHDHEAPLHVAHEMGSFNVALAIAYLITGLQPFRAGGLFPFAGVAAGLLAITAGTDLIRHETSLSDELPHLMAIGGFVLLWRLLDRSHPNSSGGLRQQLRPAARHVLRAGPRERVRRSLAVLVGAAVAIPLLGAPAHARTVLEPRDSAPNAVTRPAGH